MSIDTPNGILDITNAIVRVSKLEFQQATGFDTVLNNIARNTILLSDSATYSTASTYHNWALKLPNAWVFEAEVYLASGTSGNGDHTFQLNFYNNKNTDLALGYVLGFNDNSLTLKYRNNGTDVVSDTATLSSAINDDTWHKLFVLFERDTIAVAIDGKAEYTFTDSVLRDSVYSNDSGYVVFYHEAGVDRQIKNIKFVNGDKWLRESGSSNIAYVGGSVGVGTDAPKHTLDVFGDANVGTLTSTGIYGEIVGSNAVGASTGTFSGDLQVGTANLFVDVSTSNVGIGTDTPLATLDVQGDFSAGVTGNLFVDSSTGNVGISNAAPAHTLSVGSNLYVQDGGDTILTVLGNAVVSDKLTIQGVRVSASAFDGLQATTEADNTTTYPIIINNTTDSTSSTTGALKVSGGAGIGGSVYVGNNLDVAADVSVDGSTFNVDATQNRVGILTASPQYSLDVHGTANVGALTATSSSVSGALSGGSASISGALSTASASITGQLLVDTDTLTVDAVNDRVGVNTASPSVDLDVVGEAKVSGNVAVNTNTLFVDSVNSRVGVGTTEPSQAFEVSGNVAVNTNTLFVDTVSGNVGIGMTDPGHNLDIVSEMNLRSVSNTASIKYNSNVVTEYVRSKKLIKYPRVALTSGASNAYENGYKVTFSNQTASFQAWEAFDKNGDVVGWYTGDLNNYNGTNGAYSGTTRLASETELGEWIGLEVPTPIKLYDARIVSQSYSTATNTVDEFYIYAKKQSGDVWTNLGKFTSIAARQGTPAGVTVNVDSTDYYTFFALIATKRDQASTTNGISIRELEFYGVPEYDPEAHGTDVIMRSIPNVPNMDFLDVYVDAGVAGGYTLSGSTVSSVTDLSSPANTISVNGTVTYDSTNKAFVFPGNSTSYVKATLVDGNGNYPHTLSAWFMMTEYSSSWRCVMSLGTNTTGEQSSIAYDPGQDLLYFGQYGSDIYVPHKPQLNQWYHVVATFSGGDASPTSMNIYINGFNLGGTPSGTGTLSLTGNQLVIGASMATDGTTGNNPFEGQIANARFYRRAFTQDEVWQLYAYQKDYFLSSPDAVTFKNGRLGIGTLEPRAVLDVRGNIMADAYYGLSDNTVAYYYVPANQDIITFNNLDLRVGESYKIIFQMHMNTADGNFLLFMYVNNDTTATNYYFRREQNETWASGNTARIADTGNASNLVWNYDLRLTHDGYPVMSGHGLFNTPTSGLSNGSVQFWRLGVWTHNVYTSRIHTLTFDNSNPGSVGGYGAGSSIRIIKTL